MPISAIFSLIKDKNATTPNVKLNEPLLTLELDINEVIIFRSYIIQRIILITNYQLPDDSPIKNMHIIMYCENRNPMIFQPVEEVENKHFSSEDLKKILLGLFTEYRKPDCELTFAEYGFKREQIWDKNGVAEIYEDEIYKFYSKVHKNFSKVILKTIESNPALMQQAIDNGIQLISLGSGDARELATISTKITQKSFNCECLGLEYLSEYVVSSERKYPDFTILQHDFRELQTLNPLLIKREKVRVVIASGTLTRQIMDGAYSVATILQKVQRIIQPNLICIAGYTHPITNKDICERIGYNTQSKLIDIVREVYELIPKSLDEQINHIYKISLERSRNADFTTLDLSLTANPIELCQIFIDQNRQNTITQIDFSWSAINPNLIPELIILLNSFPNLKHITYSFNESWAIIFSNALKATNKYIIMQRNDCTDSDELPTLPVKLARDLKIYDALPTKVYYKPRVLRNEPSQISIFNNSAIARDSRQNNTNDEDLNSLKIT